jgi:hypothetical protein
VCQCVRTLRHIAASVPHALVAPVQIGKSCEGQANSTASRALERRPRGRSVVGERAASGPVARYAARRGASADGRVAGTAATSRRGGHVLRCGPLAQTMWRRGDGTGAGRVRGVPRDVRGACMHPWMAAAPTYARAAQHLKTRSRPWPSRCMRKATRPLCLSLSSLQTESTV